MIKDQVKLVHGARHNLGGEVVHFYFGFLANTIRALQTFHRPVDNGLVFWAEHGTTRHRTSGATNNRRLWSSIALIVIDTVDSGRCRARCWVGHPIASAADDLGADLSCAIPSCPVARGEVRFETPNRSLAGDPGSDVVETPAPRKLLAQLEECEHRFSSKNQILAANPSALPDHKFEAVIAAREAGYIRKDDVVAVESSDDHPLLCLLRISSTARNQDCNEGAQNLHYGHQILH